MTEQSQEPGAEKKKFTDVFKPATKDQLPSSEHFQFTDEEEKKSQGLSKEEEEMTNREFDKGEPERELNKKMSKDDMEALEYYIKLRNETNKGIAHYAMQDTFHVPMIDGRTVTYKRRGVSELEFDELERLRVQVESNSTLEEEPRQLSLSENYHMEKLWRDKQAQYYLFNTETKKMMDPAERMQCRYSFEIRLMLSGCQMRSASMGPEEKK